MTGNMLLWLLLRYVMDLLCDRYYIQADTKVLKKEFRRKKRKGGNFDYKWLGPYVIGHSLTKAFYSLKCIGEIMFGFLLRELFPSMYYIIDQDTALVNRVNGAHLNLYETSIVH